MSDTAKGTQVGELMNPNDAEQYKSEKVLANVTDRLKEMGGNPPPVVGSDKPKEVDVTDDTPTPEGDDDAITDDDEPQANDQEGTDDDDDDDVTTDDDGGEKPKDEAVTIPDKLYRAAIHSEWTPDQIVNLWKQDPELAKTTLERLHKDMVNVNNQYAEHGRAVKDLEQRQAQLQQNVPAQTQPAKQKDFVDIQQAEEEFGAGAAAIIKQLNDALVEVTSNQRQQVLPGATPEPATHKADSANREKSLAVVQQMGSWFADAGIEPYKDFYGEGRDSNGLMLLTSEHLTLEQRKNRDNLFDMAGDIEAGVALRAGTISVPDALTRAHLVLTQDMQVEMVRKSIMKKAKKRSKGITLRPNGQRMVPKETLKPGEKVTGKKVVSNATRRLAQLQAGKTMT